MRVADAQSLDIPGGRGIGMDAVMAGMPYRHIRDDDIGGRHGDDFIGECRGVIASGNRAIQDHVFAAARARSQSDAAADELQGGSQAVLTGFEQYGGIRRGVANYGDQVLA